MLPVIAGHNMRRFRSNWGVVVVVVVVVVVLDHATVNVVVVVAVVVVVVVFVIVNVFEIVVAENDAALGGGALGRDGGPGQLMRVERLLQIDLRAVRTLGRGRSVNGICKINYYHIL